MMLLYVSAAVCVLALAAVGVLLRVRRYPLNGQEKAVAVSYTHLTLPTKA